MAERSNLIIGYGERLSSDIAAPPSGGPKTHPYTFVEARKFLGPKVRLRVFFERTVMTSA